MEGIKNVELLPRCAKTLLKAIAHYQTVYLMTDYPMHGAKRSGTFNNVTSYHYEAFKILQNSTKIRFHETNLTDYGAAGIVVI